MACNARSGKGPGVGQQDTHNPAEKNVRYIRHDIGYDIGYDIVCDIRYYMMLFYNA
jgi:hypothetical protein